MLTPFKGMVLTITADNRKEFAYHELMTQALGVHAYFADFYSSWLYGLNENTSGLLRQCWPKNTDFKKVPATIIELNNRPRKN